MAEGPGLPGDAELIATDLTAAGVGSCQPPLHTGAVHEAHGASAAAWCHQSLPLLSIMADAAKHPTTGHAATYKCASNSHAS